MATGVKCKNCYHYSRVHKSWCIPKADSTDKDIIRDCQFFIKTTNADRIRAMSDEELAKFITSGYYQPHCPVGSCPVVEDCEDCWLRWLKKEVEE